jgi:hypothetical protein
VRGVFALAERIVATTPGETRRVEESHLGAWTTEIVDDAQALLEARKINEGR